MSEITKLYENAGINQVCNTCELRGFKRLCPTKELCVRTNPSFTAEILVNLEMFLINKGDFDIKKGSVDITFESFTSCIAGLINNLWQDLSEEEKQQVKGILE